MAKSKQNLKTQPYDVPEVGTGRSVVVTPSNAGDIAIWLGDANLRWGVNRKGVYQFKIKTRKGARVAVEGDTIIKFGTHRASSDPVTFAVAKAL